MGKQTIKRVIAFSTLATQAIDKKILKKEDKQLYALKKLTKKIQPLIEKHYEDVGDLRIDHASTDEKGNLILDGKDQFVFTKEKLKELNIAIRKLEGKEVEIEPHYTEWPESLPDSLKEHFVGFTVKEEDN